MIMKGEIHEAQKLIDDSIGALESKGELKEIVKRQVAKLREEFVAYLQHPEFGAKQMFFGQYQQRRSKGEYRK